MTKTQAAPVSQKDFKHYLECLDDLKVYSKHLRIVPKEGGLAAFRLWRAQEIVHRKLSKQLREKGYVRAIILKARQEGISTYTGGRFYRGVHLEPHRKVMVLAHKVKASENIFKTYERYHEYMTFCRSTKWRTPAAITWS